MTLRALRLPRCGRVAVTLLVGLLGTLSPMVASPQAALAHVGSPPTPCSGSTADDTTSDRTSTTPINGMTMKMRVLLPVGCGFPKPPTGWPLVVYLNDAFNNRCGNLYGTPAGSWYNRTGLAKDGYAVVSINPRGMPSAYYANANLGSGAGKCGTDVTAEPADSINDSGFDLGGYNDKEDIKQLIEELWTNYATATCGVLPAIHCVDKANVAIVGEGYGARLALLMPGYDSTHTYKAIVPVGFSELPGGTLPNLANNGSGTALPYDLGLNSFYTMDSNSGFLGHSDPGVFRNTEELVRDSYLPNMTLPAENANGTWTSSSNILSVSGGQTFSKRDVGQPITVVDGKTGGGTYESAIYSYISPTSVQLLTNLGPYVSPKRVRWGTKAWFDMRRFVDQDDAVDKAHLLTSSTAVFMVNNYLGKSPGISTAVEAFSRIASSNKYLYLGGCGSGGPCNNLNAGDLHNKVRDFLDKYMWGDTITMGGPVFSHTPPATDPFGSTALWPLVESTAWPPVASTTTPYYVCNRAGDDWSTTACSAPDSANKTIYNALVSSAALDPLTDFCSAVSGSTNTEVKYLRFPGGLYEFADYDIASNGSGQILGLGSPRILKVDVDMFAQSTSTRLQVNAELSEVTKNVVNNTAVIGAGNLKDVTLTTPGSTPFLPQMVGQDITISGGGLGTPLTTWVTGFYIDTVPNPDVAHITLNDAASGPASGATSTSSYEERIWQGKDTIAPALRAVTPNTPYHLVFRPGGNAWTLTPGRTLRLKIATTYRSIHAQELIPSTVTLFHDNATSHPLKVTLTTQN